MDMLPRYFLLYPIPNKHTHKKSLIRVNVYPCSKSSIKVQRQFYHSSLPPWHGRQLLCDHGVKFRLGRLRLGVSAIVSEIPLPYVRYCEATPAEATGADDAHGVTLAALAQERASVLVVDPPRARTAAFWAA